MKLTKQILRKIIKEELQHSRVLSESEVAERIKELADLVKNGVLTPEEFASEKKALLQKAKGAQAQKAQGAGGETVASGKTRMAPAAAPTDTRGDSLAAGRTAAPGLTPQEDPLVGATRTPGQQGDAAASKKLAVVAKELQVLLAKIQKEL